MDIKISGDKLVISDFDYLEVLKVAMKIEADGEKYYSSVLKRTTDERVKRTFRRLAEDEQKHYEIFKAFYDAELRERKIDPASVDVEEDLFTYIDSGIFSKEKEAKSVRSAILTGEEVELRSILFYEEFKKNTKTEGGRKALDQVLEEERMHLGILKSWEAAFPKE